MGVFIRSDLSAELGEKMAIFRVFLTLLLAAPALSLFFGPPAKECRSDRDCRGFRRTSCEGRGPNFLFIFPTCARERPYTVPGKCNVVPDTLCNIGNFLGGRNRCNDGSRCADCLANQDCSASQRCSSGRCVRRPRRNNPRRSNRTPSGRLISSGGLAEIELVQ